MTLFCVQHVSTSKFGVMFDLKCWGVSRAEAKASFRKEVKKLRENERTKSVDIKKSRSGDDMVAYVLYKNGTKSALYFNRL